MSNKDPQKQVAFTPGPAETPPNLPLPPLPEHHRKAPAGQHKRKWGGKDYPSDSFVRVTFLVTGGLCGERWVKGRTGDVPKQVFDETLKPLRQAKLWEKPKPVAKAARPATDVGSFRRR